MSSIPEEVYQEILLRLPATSLLVCKSVCRNWYSLISNPNFTKLHLNLVIQKNNPKLMLQGCDNNQIYSIGYDSLESSGYVIDNVAFEMDQPFKSLDYDVQLYGSCNGLVWICLYLYDAAEGDIFCLWNPATREYKEIAKPPKEFLGINAFGYDYKTGDYKLAMGEESCRSKGSTLLHVYTLASNSWKPEITIPYVFFNEQPSGVLVNGYLHWLAITQRNLLLVYLDFSDESFKEMQLPKELSVKNKDLDIGLGVLKGYLCLLYSSHVNDHFGVWEMLNYGVQESWTRRYIITHGSILMGHTYLNPLWSFGIVKILFLTCGILVLYDTEHRSARELSTDIDYFKDGVNYYESLVSLKSGTYVGREGRIEELRET